MSATSRISPRPTSGTATFAVVGRAKTEPLGRFAELLRDALGRADLVETDDGNTADLVINVVDEADPKSPGRGVQRRTGADHPAPDDQDVELRLGHPVQCFGPGLR